MKQENEKLISGEETQPEESMTPGGNSRVIEDPFIDTFASGTTETVTNQDFVKHGVDIQESFGSNSAYEVNLRKGKLFFTQHLFTAEGLHLPASFAVSYNQRFASSNYTTDGKPLLFKGWKLNYQQFIRFVDDKCVYVDGAFKEHVFKRSTNNTSVYLDVSIQSGTILRPATDEETFADYVIADGANTDLFFKDNRLVKIRQTRGSTPVETTITYDALNRVTQVTDGLGNNYAVHYLTNAVTITDANGTVLATLTADSNNCLESVDYYEDTDSGKVCQFTYYPSTCLLSNVRDQFAQEKAIFAYHENGKLGAIGKYVIKGDTSAEVQSKTITYYSDHTIVSQSNGSIYEEAQIRHKYTFNTNGSLANVCEIDTTGNAIGEQTFVTHENGVERHVSYKAAETISLWDEDWPAGIGPGVLIQGPIEVGNKTISIPNPNNNTMDVTFSWHMEYEDLFLPYPDSIITVEFLVNDSLVCTREYPVAETISLDETCTVKSIPTTTETRIVLRVTPPYSEQPVFISNVQATYRPYSEYKKEMYIKNPNPNGLAFANPMYMTEIVNDEVVYWYPVSQTQFLVNGNFVYPNVFTINDYTKTMQSYFLTGKYNFYYNDCRDVIYQATNVSLCYEDQDFELVDAPLEIMTKSIIPISFEHISIEGSNLKISQRRYGSADNYCYSKLDPYLRPVTEFRAGTPVQTHQYDRFGNETELYSGGTTGIRSTSTYSTNGQSFIKNIDYIHTDTPTTEYEHNTDGLVSQITTPINQEINFDYQNKNLLSRVSAVVANQTNANDIAYDGHLITSLSHNGTSFQFVYDERNNISEVKVAGATLLSKSAVYNTNGSFVTQSTYSNQQVVKKHYDKYGRIIKISDATSAESVLAKFIYSDEEVATDITEPTDNRLLISGSSKLRVVIDATANTRTVYSYDSFGQLCKMQNQNITTTQTLDDYNRVAKVQQSFVSGGNMETIYQYVSATDGNLASETTNWDMPGTISTTYTRDTLQRPTETTVMVGNIGHKYAYSYVPRQEEVWVEDSGFFPIIRPDSVGTNAVTPPSLGGHWEVRNIGTTPYISSFKEYSMSGTTATLVRTDSIEYDANGNIIQYGNVTYEYDGLNRLVRENNPGIDKTTIWHYNTSGNITSKSEFAYTTSASPTGGTTTAFIYGTSWRDQLSVISVGTTAKHISYDQAGNPTTYKGATLTWTRGRLLASYTPSGSTVQRTLKYDANGIRCAKNTRAFGQDDITVYVYNGNNLIREYRVNEPYSQKTFLYNSQGVIGFVYQGVTYTYRKNLFGDIVAIYNGSTKVAEYKYDAWGNQKIMDGNSNVTNDLTHIANVNPFRYRGYYWEDDLKLYYLMSRYYDPQVGRFINADSLEYLDPETIGGLNLYAYCNNDPIAHCDPSGHFLISTAVAVGFWIGLTIGAIAGATAGGIIAYNTAKDSGAEGWELFGWTLAGIVGGGLAGGIVGGVIGAAIGYGVGLIWGSAPVAGSNGAVALWSGGKGVAAEATKFAGKTGAKLVSKTFAGKTLSFAQHLMPKAVSKYLWGQLSAEFVAGAASATIFLDGAGISATSVFYSYELWVLLEKGIERLIYFI